MANKYHRQGFKAGKLVDIFQNIYKLDKTGKKDEIIESMNKRIKTRKTKTFGPAEIERYTDIMSSDFETKTGPFFEKIRAREIAKQKAAELKKLKGKK
mgnify:FL=1|tara:strand:- start:362 stop:655 length:294 start_codon:yes stop_codon:yes gene_type:complete